MRRIVHQVLHGFTVGLTADRRWDEQASLFERRGATVLHAPTIRTLPLACEDTLRRATIDIIERPPAVLIANTGLGMRSWFGAAESWALGEGLIASLRQAKIFARGPKASGAVHSMGLDVVARASTERLCDAVELALPFVGPGTRVALQVDGSGTAPEIERLVEQGAQVLLIPIYEWKLPTDIEPAVRLAKLVITARVHAVTFTTGPAIRNWLAVLGEHDLAADTLAACNDGAIVIGCVGPVCADTAVACGLRRDRLVVPAAFRLGPLVRAVADRLMGQVNTLTVRGSVVTLAGNGVTVDGDRIDLSDIDARLLTALAATPDVVVSKADLLDRVWADGTNDEHAVEVAIARLRRRLGDLGAAVIAVPRRGYALSTR